MDARRCVLRPAAWAPLPAGLIVMRHILCQDEAAKRPDFMHIVHPLNRYSRLHAEAIFGRHATLDKCIGGAIMAFRGVTTDQPDHACHAQRRFNHHCLATLKGRDGKVHRYEPAWELA